MKILKEYLVSQNISVYRISKDNGINYSTIFNASEKETLDPLSWKLLKAIAHSLNKSVGQVADELVELENKTTSK